MEALDKITDELYKAKLIIECMLKLRCSVNDEVIDNLKKAAACMNNAKMAANKAKIDAKIDYSFDFLNDDIHYIIMFDFYRKLVDILESLNKLYNELCKRQLDI